MKRKREERKWEGCTLKRSSPVRTWRDLAIFYHRVHRFSTIFDCFHDFFKLRSQNVGRAATGTKERLGVVCEDRMSSHWNCTMKVWLTELYYVYRTFEKLSIDIVLRIMYKRRRERRTSRCRCSREDARGPKKSRYAVFVFRFFFFFFFFSLSSE